MNTLVESSSNKFYEMYSKFMDQTSIFIEYVGFKCGINTTLFFGGIILLFDVGFLTWLSSLFIWDLLTPGYKFLELTSIIITFIVIYLFYLVVNELGKKLDELLTGLKQAIAEKDATIAMLTKKLEDKQRQLLDKTELLNKYD